ncbi:hypothetical protein [Streptomyces sp. NPDC047123]|uniref:hypothetical protein n=1 Tax=Streptomyces sp. NPDC047123 TaxID=3155622 RepID=UPI0033F850F1
MFTKVTNSMFTKRRERKQAELHEELAAVLRSPDAAVRAAAATRAAEAAGLEWALRELASAVAREPWTDDFDEGVVDGFAIALRRDAKVRGRAERLVARHLDDPEGFVRAWAAFVAGLGGPPGPQEVGEDLQDDMRAHLTSLRAHGWTAEGLDGLGPPGFFARDLAFDLAVVPASLVLLRNRQLPPAEAERVRAKTREVLERALAFPPDSDDRLDLIAPLAEIPDAEAWTDRALRGIRLDETLALCASDDDARAALGVEALHHQCLCDDILRRRGIIEALDHLVAREREPMVLQQILDCYGRLHVLSPLETRPVELFRTALGHADADVRKSAASGMGLLTRGTPDEIRAVGTLVGILDHDVDEEVRGFAAQTLAGMARDEEERGTRTIADAMARHAGSASPLIRAATLQHALEDGAPDAYDRLLVEFDSPDVPWPFLAACQLVLIDDDFSIPDDIRPRLVERLERLRTSGWAERDVDPGGYPDPDDRAEMLAELLEQVRAVRG